MPLHGQGIAHEFGAQRFNLLSPLLGQQHQAFETAGQPPQALLGVSSKGVRPSAEILVLEQRFTELLLELHHPTVAVFELATEVVAQAITLGQQAFGAGSLLSGLAPQLLELAFELQPLIEGLADLLRDAHAVHTRISALD